MHSHLTHSKEGILRSKDASRWGGRDLDGLSNVVFSNGNYDPWSGGGVLESQSKTLIAVHVDQGAHHLDVRSALTLSSHSNKS